MGTSKSPITRLPSRAVCDGARPCGGERPLAILWVVKTERGRPLFRDPVLASHALSRLDRGPGVLAAVVMPASIRLLADAELWRMAELERYQLDCQRFFHRRGYRGSLWHKGDPVRRRVAGSSVRRTARQILQRPVARGLVEWSRNYPWAVIRRRRLDSYEQRARYPGRRKATRAPTGASRIRS